MADDAAFLLGDNGLVTPRSGERRRGIRSPHPAHLHPSNLSNHVPTFKSYESSSCRVSTTKQRTTELPTHHIPLTPTEVVHIVLWKLKKPTTGMADAIAQAKHAISALKQVPGPEVCHLGPPLIDARAKGYDWGELVTPIGRPECCVERWDTNPLLPPTPRPVLGLQLSR
jgi:hypothetical protein